LKQITSFTGDYDFLSNSYKSPVEFNGIEYATVDACYWAQRPKDEHSRIKFARLKPAKAKAKAINAIPRDDWDDVKVNIMNNILLKKFGKEELKKKLLDTGNAELINNVSYNDEFYGVHYGNGENILGKLLMQIRDKIKSEK